ncbi:hypothetical protein V1478_002671 [Vespula squamosa]|uniref:Uncharacterized protein n=1 Tax=Vespula squamosa TaxID=30214 RepID=A0ABD2BT80_VESSQ
MFFFENIDNSTYRFKFDSCAAHGPSWRKLELPESMLSLNNNNLVPKLIRESDDITNLRVTLVFLSDSNRRKIEPNRCRLQDLQCDCFASVQSGGYTTICCYLSLIQPSP